MPMQRSTGAVYRDHRVAKKPTFRAVSGKLFSERGARPRPEARPRAETRTAA